MWAMQQDSQIRKLFSNICRVNHARGETVRAIAGSPSAQSDFCPFKRGASTATWRNAWRMEWRDVTIAVLPFRAMSQSPSFQTHADRMCRTLSKLFPVSWHPIVDGFFASFRMRWHYTIFSIANYVTLFSEVVEDRVCGLRRTRNLCFSLHSFLCSRL